MAEFFLSERDRVPFLTADAVAAALGVSRLTVLRTARTLGYDGLAELKDELGHALQRSTAARRFVETAAHLDARDGGTLERALAFQVEALQETRRVTPPDAVQKAIHLLAGAERVVVYAQETSRGLGDSFVQRLRRMGWQAIGLSGSGVALADELMQLRPGDVLVAIGDESDPQLSVILDQAKEHRVRCIFVTNSLGMTLKGRYVVLLPARRGPGGDTPTFAAELLILETLALGLAATRAAAVRSANHRLRRLREQLSPSDRARAHARPRERSTLPSRGRPAAGR